MLTEWFERITRWYLRRRGVACRYIPTSKGRIHVLDAPGSGSLPPILLLHGISSSSVPYARLLLRLRAHTRRVIALDTLGHGASDEPPDAEPESLVTALLETFDQVIDEPVIVFGNSLGGAAAIRLALQRPERIRGLIACSPAGAPMDEPTFKDFLTRFDLDAPGQAQRFVQSLYFRPPIFAPVLVGEVRRVFRRPFVRRLIQAFRPHHLFSPEEVRALAVPTLLLWGRGDRLMTPEQLDFFRANLPPHAELEEPEEFGHCPHLDHPGRLAARILDFSRKVSHG